ncbi:maltose phosphorylase [Cutibacterium acnes JCM 18909]|nr:maltose phosphorylase [Cutibacterium acnes JCM 18909]
MTRTGTDPMDRWRFPDDPWAIVETAPSTDDLGTTETLFSIGNGYLGMRGNPSEGRDSFSHGTYINGFHEIWDIHHAENAYGFARTGQTIVNVPDAKLMKLYVDDEPLLLSINEIQSYKRWIDFREGVLRRELVWRTPAGKLLRVATSRMVSFTHRHMALISIEVTMLEGDARSSLARKSLTVRTAWTSTMLDLTTPRRLLTLAKLVNLPTRCSFLKKRLAL